MVESGNPRDMIMGAEDAEGDAIDSYSQSRVQRREARMTVQMDINRLLIHLRRVRGETVEIQRGTTGRHTANMAWGRGW